MDIIVKSFPYFSLALAHNKIDLIRILALHGSFSYEGISIHYELSTSEGMILQDTQKIEESRSVEIEFDTPDNEEEEESFTLFIIPKTIYPNLSLLGSLEEDTTGTLKVSVLDADNNCLTEYNENIHILSRSHWIDSPGIRVYQDILASYSQPNDPVVHKIRTQVLDHFLKKFKKSYKDPYSVLDPKYIDNLVKSVYDVLAKQKINYAHPPVSWGNGQKVRTPTQVIDERQGTCLDTTMTFASILESLKIRPLIFLYEGHATVAYWRQPNLFEEATTEDYDQVKNLLDLGDICILETTLITQNAPSVKTCSFEDSCARAHVNFLEKYTFEAVVDIIAARRERILPLPSYQRGEKGEIIEHDTSYTLAIEDKQYVGLKRKDNQENNSSLPLRVTQWKNQLLDLTLRNRLINFTSRSGILFAIPKYNISSFEDRLNAGYAVNLKAANDIPGTSSLQRNSTIFDLDWNDEENRSLFDNSQAHIALSSFTYASSLQKMLKDARTIEEETGANNLYITVGTLNWKLDSKELMSPLFLIPVRLISTNRGRSFKIFIDDSGQSTPNYCLLEKLKQEFNLELPSLENPVMDKSGVDLEAAFNGVRNSIKEAQLSFSVDSYVFLSLLNFSKFRMWKDLEESWEVFAKNPLVNHLIYQPNTSFIDPVQENAEKIDSDRAGRELDDLALHMPLPCDASQLDAIKAAVHGETFVLEGPPGTGKSQTITNLLTHAIERGKKVLFVAEKRAALEVVQQRINNVGLSHFVLELHDKKATPAAVRSQLLQSLEALDNAVHNEDEQKAFVLSAQSDAASLRKYAQGLHEPNAAGYSAYTSYNMLSTLADSSVKAANIPFVFLQNTREENIDTIKVILGDIAAHLERINPHILAQWAPFLQRYPLVQKDHLDAVIYEFKKHYEALEDQGITEEERKLLTQPSLAQYFAYLCDIPEYSPQEIEAFRNMGEEQLLSLRTYLASVDEDPTEGLIWAQYFQPSILDSDVPDLLAKAQEYVNAGLFKRKTARRTFLESIRPYLLEELDIHKDIDPKNIVLVLEAASAASTKRKYARNLLKKIGIRGIPDHGSLQGSMIMDHEGSIIENKNNSREESVYRIITRDEQLSILEYLSAVTAEQDSIHTLFLRLREQYSLVELRNCARTYQQVCEALAAYFSTYDSECALRILEELSVRTEQSLAALMSTVMVILEKCEELKGYGLKAFAQEILSAEYDSFSLPASFEKGLIEATWRERVDTHMLETYTAERNNMRIAQYENNISHIREILPEVLPATVAAHRKIDFTTKRGNVGNLRRQINRKRGGMSIRALFENFSKEILDLSPCVLMSPASVAQFLPPRADIFDIVIFDEASQVRVSDAVGAMGRARSVVIVGDSKQMPPSNNFEKNITIDEEEIYELGSAVDEESILSECNAVQVQSRWLSWHYRSQSEELIAFSNHNYYAGKLSSFPEPQNIRVDHGISGLHFQRVHGRFIRSSENGLLRVNIEEAEAIAQEIERLFDASPDKDPSIGVVTFNIQQQNYIENLLRSRDNDRIVNSLDTPGGIFVKNLENVQGDERDIILFSIAFSHNEKGNLPLNFGALSRQGGERRLNVAATRARMGVKIFCSFDPEDLHAERSTSRGLKDLRDYLRRAQRNSHEYNLFSSESRRPDFHRKDIFAKLSAAGIHVQENVGLSDFKIDFVLSHPEKPELSLVAVLLDDPKWAQRVTTADRDVLPLSFLEKHMGWPKVERIWLMDWINNSDRIVEHLLEEVEELYEEQELLFFDIDFEDDELDEDDEYLDIDYDDDEEEEEEDLEDDELDDDDEYLDINYDNDEEEEIDDFFESFAQYYELDSEDESEDDEDGISIKERIQLLPFVGYDLDDEAVEYSSLSSQARNKKLSEKVVFILEHEGPILVEDACRRAFATFGFQANSETRLKAFIRAMKADPKIEYKKADKDYLWLKEWDEESYCIVRYAPEGEQRMINSIPLIERVYAIIYIAAQDEEKTKEEIYRGVINLWNLSRLTTNIISRLDAALAYAQEKNFLSVEGTIRAF